MRKIDLDQVFKDGRKILNSNLNIDSIRGIFEDIETDKVYIIDVCARDNYTLQAIALKSDADSIIIELYINDILCYIAQEPTATTVITDFAITANNNVVVGDCVTMKISEIVDDATILNWNLKCKRV